MEKQDLAYLFDALQRLEMALASLETAVQEKGRPDTGQWHNIPLVEPSVCSKCNFTFYPGQILNMTCGNLQCPTFPHSMVTTQHGT